MDQYTDYINNLTRLLAFYESERKRIGMFLDVHQKASISITSIEFDVTTFIAKKGMNKKSEERLKEVDNLRDLDEKYSVLLMRYESVLRECDKLRNIVISQSDEIKLLNQIKDAE